MTGARRIHKCSNLIGVRHIPYCGDLIGACDIVLNTKKIPQELIEVSIQVDRTAWFKRFPVNAAKSTLVKREDLWKRG